jgi:hypothetical protein
MLSLSRALFSQTELNDADLFDNRISVGWGKAVKIYPSPFALPHSHRQLSSAALANEVKTFFSQFEFTKSGRGGGTSSSRRDCENRRVENESNRLNRWERGPQATGRTSGSVVVAIPSDRRIRSVIDDTARIVSREGDACEQVETSLPPSLLLLLSSHPSFSCFPLIPPSPAFLSSLPVITFREFAEKRRGIQTSLSSRCQTRHSTCTIAGGPMVWISTHRTRTVS